MVNAVGMSTSVVTTRKMQSVHYTVVLLSYAIFGAIVLVLILSIEALVTQQLRLAHYSWEAWSMTLAACLFNNFALSFQTIAMQNERPGFVTLVSYVGLVYAFAGDLVFFGETYTFRDLICILVILSLNVAVVVYNF